MFRQKHQIKLSLSKLFLILYPALFMLIFLSPSDFSILKAKAVTINKLWVGDSDEVTSTGTIQSTGATSGTATVSTEGDAVVLTLNNFVYEGQGYNSSSGIRYDGKHTLIIELVGENRVTQCGVTNSFAIIHAQDNYDLIIRSTNKKGSLYACSNL